MLPSTGQEAIADKDWKQSMDQEIKSLTDNGTWTLEELPRGRKAMKTKWAYKIKRDSAGIQTKLKSRLNACGYSQVSGTDYDETYAPVGSKCLLRSFLAIAAYLDYEVQQIDFDSAFLNGKLDHELYMHQPGGYSDGTGRVCKLQKSIYGLKQAAIVWYDTLQKLLSENGYEPSTRESCLFLLKPGRTGPAWIYVYVDDLLIIGPKGSCTQLAKNLSAKFKTKELGDAEFCLGIKITRNKKGILLTQKAFADAMVKDMMDVTIKAKRTYTAMPMNRVSEEADDDLLDDPSRYRSLVGAIGYLANTTRPDLSVAFSALGSSMKSPTKKSWKLAQHCLGYIKETADIGLFYRVRAKDEEMESFEDGLEIYSDSDWAGSSNNNRRSRSGSHVLLFGGTIDWKSKLQSVISLSSTEAEYYAAIQTSKMALYLRVLFYEMQKGKIKISDRSLELQLPPLKIWMDNQLAMAQICSAEVREASKHIQVRITGLRKLPDQGI